MMTIAPWSASYCPPTSRRVAPPGPVVVQWGGGPGVGLLFPPELAEHVLQRLFGLMLNREVQRRLDGQHAVVSEPARGGQRLYLFERPVEVEVRRGFAG